MVRRLVQSDGKSRTSAMRISDEEHAQVVHLDFRDGIPYRSRHYLFVNGCEKLFGDPPEWMTENQ